MKELDKLVELPEPDVMDRLEGMGKHDYQYVAMHYSAAKLRTYGQACYEAGKQSAAGTGWVEAADQELVCAHLGVANSTDTQEDAARKLRELIDLHVAIATDPAVNGGYKLVPVDSAAGERVDLEPIRSRLRGLIAEIDPSKKPATGVLRLVTEELRWILSALLDSQKSGEGEKPAIKEST